MLSSYNNKALDMAPKRITPGPGEYSMKGMPSNSLSYSIAKKERELACVYGAYIGHYEVNYDSVSKARPSAFLAGRKEQPQANDFRNYSPYSQLLARQVPGPTFPKEARVSPQQSLITELPLNSSYDTIGLMPSYMARK
jgi:hypothetical protein